MATPLKDIKTLLENDRYPLHSYDTEPLQILTEAENAQVDQMMQDLLSADTPGDKSHDD